MSMKIGTSKPMSAMGAAPSQQASSPQKVKTATGQEDMPAYIVELSERHSEEKQDDSERIRAILHNFKSVSEDLKEGSIEEFYEKWRTKQKALVERYAEQNSALLESPDPYFDELYWKGDQILGINIYAEHWTEGEKIHNPLYAEANERFEKYRNVLSKISAGGKETFRQYNLNLASMAVLSNTAYADKELEKRITRGHTTREEYARAKTYANELQNRAGVFVAPDFSSPSTKFAARIRYEYNGTLANIGVKELDFMARHQEADDVWVKVAQGAYKNHSEITTALADAGLNDTATAYHEFITGLTRKHYSLNDAMTAEFSHERGELWEAVTNDINGYDRMRNSMRGDDASPLRYTPSEINRALSDGADEIKFLERLSRERDPLFLVQTKDGRWVKAEDATKEKQTLHRESPLEDELHSLRKQLAEVRKSSISDDQKQSLIETIKHRINTILTQLLSEQQGAAKQQKYQ